MTPGIRYHHTWGLFNSELSTCYAQAVCAGSESAYENPVAELDIYIPTGLLYRPREWVSVHILKKATMNVCRLYQNISSIEW